MEEMARKIRILVIEKISAAKEKATFLHSISQDESNVEILKSNLNEKSTNMQNMNE